jgi:Putative DNA-binding domain
MRIPAAGQRGQDPSHIAVLPEADQALLSQGEGLQVEFKRQLPENSDESKRTLLKTIAVFANGHGGSIVFGIEKDEATVRGLEGTDLIAARDRLTQLVRSIVTPHPRSRRGPMNGLGTSGWGSQISQFWMA